MRHYNKTDILSKGVWAVSLTLIGFSFYLLFLLYWTNRSLWIDEAMLAFSFTQRSFGDLVKGIFLWDQSAPILYLYMVKIITIVFGVSEFTLRVFSLLTYFLTLFLAYKVMDKEFKIKYPILAAAFLSNMRVLLYYANEFKQYMPDAFAVLLILYLYYLYSEKKLDFKLLFLVYAIIIWFSYPTVFFSGGVLVYEFIISVAAKDNKKVLCFIAGGVLIVASFFINYLIWLKPVANSEYMLDFWLDYNFPLIPLSLADIKRIFILSGGLLSHMKFNVIFVGVLIVCGVVISFTKITKYHIVVYISISLTLLASFIGKYPFNKRLMLFIYPILVIYIFIAIDEIMGKDTRKSVVVIGIILSLFLSNYSSFELLNKNNRYIGRNDTNPLIDYVDENIVEGEMLYVYYRAIPAYVFKMGHNNESIGKNVKIAERNVIFGKGTLPDEKKGIDNVDIRDIKKYKKCYILISHHDEERIDGYLEELEKYGEISLVMEKHNTPLYYFQGY